MQKILRIEGSNVSPAVAVDAVVAVGASVTLSSVIGKKCSVS